MTDWKHRIKLRDILESAQGDYDNANDEINDVKRVGNEIYERLRDDEWFNKFNLNQFLLVITVNQIEKALNDLFDYCDDHLIWVEMQPVESVESEHKS